MGVDSEGSLQQNAGFAVLQGNQQVGTIEYDSTVHGYTYSGHLHLERDHDTCCG